MMSDWVAVGVGHEGATAEESGLTDVACAACGKMLTGPIADQFVYYINGDLKYISLFHVACKEKCYGDR